ncbi:hypothetical protein T492DRAFT_860949 [Pavlovales sp. CCMP2436]|nr:hypothetical protein T492DRAFT_860949 [Pavlovales sp. CCMP2436]
MDFKRMDFKRTEWTVADLDQYGSYATPHFAHSQLYYCERFCALGCDEEAEGAKAEGAAAWFRLARLCAERAARARTRLQAWRCAGALLIFSARPGSAMDLTQRISSNRTNWESNARRQVQGLYHNRFGPPTPSYVMFEASRRDPVMLDRLRRGRETQAANWAQALAQRTAISAAHEARHDQQQQQQQPITQQQQQPQQEQQQQSAPGRKREACVLREQFLTVRLVERGIEGGLDALGLLEDLLRASAVAMSAALFMDAQDFDQKLLGVELHYMKPAGENQKLKSTVRVTYGPNKRALALISPLMAADWPLLGPEGNMGSKFGPDSPDKAVFTLGLADRAIEGIESERVQQFFAVLNLVDERVADFVYTHQKEVLNARDLSLKAVRGKMSPAVKQRYDNDLPTYKRVNVSVRIMDYNGNRRHLPQLDCNRQPLLEGHEIRHEDVLMAAVFGIKWAPVQLMLLRRRADHSPAALGDIFAGTALPAWATPNPQQQPQPASSESDMGYEKFGFH